MILQALTEYYRTLEAAGKISAPGWAQVKVSFALCINEKGDLEQLLNVQTEQPRGKKLVLAPQLMCLPSPVKKTSGKKSNFLFENSSYLLGLDENGVSKRTIECFKVGRMLHESILKDTESEAAKALLEFFRRWDPEAAMSHPALADHLDELKDGGNLVFRYRGSYIHEDPMIRAAWEESYNSQGDGPEMVCLVTGKKEPVENIHPSIKNVQGAQSSGAALVSFNSPAACSYGKEQNYNAPTGKFAAFAYTTALNYLLADREHVYRVGDTTVVCWARSGQSIYQTLFGGAFFDGPIPYDENDLRGLVRRLCRGDSFLFENERLEADMEFYVLGLAPNAARLSVRFFLRNSYGNFLRNAMAHQDRLEIVHPGYEKDEDMPLWKLLGETVNQKSTDKSPTPNMAGAVLRSILTDTPYPATMLNAVTLRIRAERELTGPRWRRAAIIKAYYLKNIHSEVPKEVLTVSLNPDSTNIPYILGRLFSLLEAVQDAANPGINATIKDKYFNSASATPAQVFPVLINLAQKHMRKLKEGQRVFYDKQLTELLGKLEDSYPDHLSLPQQGSFQLGYYHQTQARYIKKEEN